MADIYSTSVLNGVVSSLIGNPQFLIDRYFSNIQTSAVEEIHFDTLDGKRRVSPFVSPLVEGQIVASLGYKTSSFRPAYIKDKRVLDMNKPLKRMAGERFTGAMSPMDRLRALIAQDSMDQLNMLRRRLEAMAGQILSGGSCRIEGEKYPMVQLDFGCPPIVTLNWTVPATATPLDDLEALAMASLQSGGVLLNDVLMTPQSWALFKNSRQVLDNLTMWRTWTAPPSLTNVAPITEGGVFMGTIAGFNIYVYSGWFVDPLTNAELPMIHSPVDSTGNIVVLTSSALEGYQAYGAIRDEEAGLQALPYFSKSWIEPDPSVRFLMLQSAPLLVPYRPSALVRAQVNGAT